MAGALDLRRGPQGPALVASGKAISLRVTRGPLGILLPSIPGPQPCEELEPELEDSSPVLIWILGNFWSLPRGVSPRLEWGHARAVSSRAVEAVPRFHSRGSWICGFPSRLSQETFPRGFPTGLSHMPPWCESILGLTVETVQGKQVSLEWTETSGGLWKWWHDPGFPLAFPVESSSS